MGDRLSAWNFGGRKCPRCGFKGASLYKETCWKCGGSLVYCPKCRSVECLGLGNNGTRNDLDIMKGLLAYVEVTEKTRKAALEEHNWLIERKKENLLRLKLIKTYVIYWWAKVGGQRKKFGHDTIKFEGEIDEDKAEDILESIAEGAVTLYSEYLKNFSDYYPNSNFPENYGLVKVIEVDKK